MYLCDVNILYVLYSQKMFLEILLVVLSNVILVTCDDFVLQANLTNLRHDITHTFFLTKDQTIK